MFLNISLFSALLIIDLTETFHIHFSSPWSTFSTAQQPFLELLRSLLVVLKIWARVTVAVATGKARAVHPVLYSHSFFIFSFILYEHSSSKLLFISDFQTTGSGFQLLLAVLEGPSSIGIEPRPSHMQSILIAFRAVSQSQISPSLFKQIKVCILSSFHVT